jgi:hypothetical protein
MRRLRIALLPHVFVSGRRPAPPRAAYITPRDLRAAIAANAALMRFAAIEPPATAPPDAEFALGTPPGHAPASAGDAATPPNAAPAQPPNVAPRRGRAA